MSDVPFRTQPINPSYLSDPRNWTPPDRMPPVSRSVIADDRALVRAVSEQIDLENHEFTRRFRRDSSDRAEQLCRILASQQLNFNGGRVRANIGPRIAAACGAGEVIRIVMPCFCKIGNTAKLIWSLRPTAAEEISLRHLAHVSRALQSWYAPGVRFVLVTDARLYASYLRNVAPTVAAYNQGLQELRREVAPNGEVELIEYDDLIAPFSHEFEQAYAEGLRRIERNDAGFFGELSRAALFESVRNNLNTRSLEMTYQDLFECFGPQRNPANRFHDLLDRMASESLVWKLAIRAACRSVEERVFSRWFGPNYLRATIHLARGENPVLGLRIYPEYKRSSDVLPYHGAPLVYREGERVKMLVAPETRFWRDGLLERVTHHENETYVYLPRAEVRKSPIRPRCARPEPKVELGTG